jgi:surfeit locus 1 family protein
MSRSVRALAGVVTILALCAMCVRLGFWQLDRLEQRRARNAVTRAGLRHAPVRLDAAALAAADRDPGAWRYRRATARGRYLPAGELVLRGRSDEGRPGVHVVTPLRVAGRVLLVNRGWLPAPDGVRPSVRPAAPAGEVEVTGLLMEIPRTRDRGAPSASGGVTSYRRLDLDRMRAVNGAALAPLFLQVTGTAGDGLPRPVPPPPLDEGPHLGYALQWFSFAAIGVVGLIVLYLRGRRDTPR